ncbi:hypothetical protein C0993_003335 [Termitomyces sp. T159_Od127]|nr:hypothetical protein C0993_003335 [Termitomyces sp. T159_Od127]
MVGAINPPSSGNTFSAYQSNAAKSSASGQGEGGLVGIGASASTGPGPVASGVLLFPGVPGASTSPTSNSGGSGSNQNGSLNMAVNLFVVTLSMILGSYL